MENLDQSLFVFFNSTISNDFFDSIIPPITDLHKSPIVLWIILPLIMTFWIYKQGKKMIPVFLGMALCVGIVDNITYRVFKPTFKRPRPPQVEKQIILRSDRHAGYGFPSNHAANNFAAATFLSYCYPAATAILYAVASLVAFSRVYVGVHYPGDVLAGGLFGLIFGLFFFKIWVIILFRVGRRWPSLELPVNGKTTGGSSNDDQQGNSPPKNI